MQKTMTHHMYRKRLSMAFCTLLAHPPAVAMPLLLRPVASPIPCMPPPLPYVHLRRPPPPPPPAFIRVSATPFPCVFRPTPPPWVRPPAPPSFTIVGPPEIVRPADGLRPGLLRFPCLFRIPCVLYPRKAATMPPLTSVQKEEKEQGMMESPPRGEEPTPQLPPISPSSFPVKSPAPPTPPSPTSPPVSLQPPPADRVQIAKAVGLCWEEWLFKELGISSKDHDHDHDHAVVEQEMERDNLIISCEDEPESVKSQQQRVQLMEGLGLGLEEQMYREPLHGC